MESEDQDQGARTQAMEAEELRKRAVKHSLELLVQKGPGGSQGCDANQMAGELASIAGAAEAEEPEEPQPPSGQ